MIDELLIDDQAVEAWVRQYVLPVGPSEVVHRRPWASVARVPVENGIVWFKACAPAQAFEPRLTAELSARWPERVVEVLAYDTDRRWLLLADAGMPVGALDNPPEVWLTALPAYAELQIGEAARVGEHLAHGVPDLRVPRLAEQYADLLRADLPIERDEVNRLRAFAPMFGDLCRELQAYGVPESIQHDDLHHSNLYARDGALRMLDWGDASVGHPFASLVVTFRFLEQRTGLEPTSPWFTTLRDAYLEPWGSGLEGACALALRVGAFGRAIACLRQRAVLAPAERVLFDTDLTTVVRRAIRAMPD